MFQASVRENLVSNKLSKCMVHITKPDGHVCNQHITLDTVATLEMSNNNPPSRSRYEGGIETNITQKYVRLCA